MCAVCQKAILFSRQYASRDIYQTLLRKKQGTIDVY